MTDNLELKKDVYLPLRDVVFQTLRTAILKGELKPGERLMELGLAARLGVSRTPVREAIRMLEHEGLAVTIPRKGAQVAGMTEKDTEDVLQIRISLETLAAGLSCEKVTREVIEELKFAMHNFEEKTKGTDVVEIAHADERFHDVFYKASDNARLMHLVNGMREQMYRYRLEYLKIREYYPRLIGEHRDIYDAIRDGDKERVLSILRTHLTHQLEAVKQMIRNQGKI